MQSYACHLRDLLRRSNGGHADQQADHQIGKKPSQNGSFYPAGIVAHTPRQLRHSEYVLAARAMGGGFFHVLMRHLFPNFFSAILFMVVMNLRGAIVAESTLSFLGLGLPLEAVSWGSMLSLSEKALLSGAWWVILIPGAFLIAVLLCVTNLGNYLRRQASRKESNL